MRNTTTGLKRIIGGGFAVAVAAAFVIPGVAAADEPTADTGSVSLSSLTDTGSAGGGAVTTQAADDEDGDSLFGSVSDVLACFSTDDGGDEGTTTTAADEDDSDALGSVSTVIDCVTAALGGGDDDSGDA